MMKIYNLEIKKIATEITSDPETEKIYAVYDQNGTLLASDLTLNEAKIFCFQHYDIEIATALIQYGVKSSVIKNIIADHTNNLSEGNRSDALRIYAEKIIKKIENAIKVEKTALQSSEKSKGNSR